MAHNTQGNQSPPSGDEDRSQIPGIQRDQDSLTKYLRSMSQHVDVTEVKTHLGCLPSCWKSDSTGFTLSPSVKDSQPHSSVQAKAGSNADHCSGPEDIAASANGHTSTTDEDQMHIGGWCKESQNEGGESGNDAELNPGMEEANDASTG